ncbi:MAG: hypothetical protein QHH24_00535 [Candidatus Bathyarchaeota archaeon]|nr:hypothetical protein [Candidatus Bathyarchaeota archaeon]
MCKIEYVAKARCPVCLFGGNCGFRGFGKAEAPVFFGQVVIAKTVTLEPAYWELERPEGDVDIDISHRAENIVASNELSANLSAIPRCHLDGSELYAAVDEILVWVTARVSMKSGFVTSMNVSFFENSGPVKVTYSSERGSDYGLKYVNLKVESYASCINNPWLLENETRAFVFMKGVSQPKNVSFADGFHLCLQRPYNQTHQVSLRIEVTYLNGSVFKRLIQPFEFKVSPDDNNTFDTAQEVAGNGTYPRLFIGGYDVTDFYKIQVKQGQEISVHFDSTVYAGPLEFYSFLYDPSRASRVTSNMFLSEGNITFSIDMDGYWFIEIRSYTDDYGFYMLEVGVEG